jgi:hypothetical protein
MESYTDSKYLGTGFLWFNWTKYKNCLPFLVRTAVCSYSNERRYDAVTYSALIFVSVGKNTVLIYDERKVGSCTSNTLCPYV